MVHLELIGKYLSKESTPHENEQLLSWIQANPENKLEFIELCNIWNATSINKPTYNHVKAYNQFRERTQQNAVVKMSKPTKSVWKTIGKYSIPVAAALMLTLGALYLFKPSPELTRYANTTKNIKTVKLPDGSTAYLNQGATLTAPTEFDNKTRSVSMTGVVFFEVEKNKQKPFIIGIGNGTVTVKGTSFNVDYDSIQAKCNVIVNTGTVVLASNTNKSVTLTKNEKGFIDLKKDYVVESINNDVNYLSWKTGILTFKNTNFVQVCKDLERHYGVTISYPTDLDKNLALTATFDHETIESSLKILELTFNVTIEKQNSIFVVRK